MWIHIYCLDRATKKNKTMVDPWLRFIRIYVVSVINPSRCILKPSCVCVDKVVRVIHVGIVWSLGGGGTLTIWCWFTIWWRHKMETFSILLALCEDNPPVNRWIPLTKELWCLLRLSKWLSKQSRRQRFETPSCSLWRHCKVWVNICGH